MTDQDEPPQQNPIILLFNTERSFKSFEKNNKHLLYYVTNRFNNNFKECVVSVPKNITIKFDESENEMLMLGAVNKNNNIYYVHVSLENKKKELHNFDYCHVDLVID